MGYRILRITIFYIFFFYFLLPSILFLGPCVFLRKFLFQCHVILFQITKYDERFPNLCYRLAKFLF